MDIIRRVWAVCGDATMCRSSVYEWVVKFKVGHQSPEDEAWSGRPNTATMDEAINRVGSLIKCGRYFHVWDIAMELDISKASG